MSSLVWLAEWFANRPSEFQRRRYVNGLSAEDRNRYNDLSMNEQDEEVRNAISR